MDNLTIEQERKAFEEFLLSSLGSSFNEWWCEHFSRYQNNELNQMWKGWLARAELANKFDDNKSLLHRILINLRSVKDLPVSEHQALVNRINSIVTLIELANKEGK